MVGATQNGIVGRMWRPGSRSCTSAPAYCLFTLIHHIIRQCIVAVYTLYKIQFFMLIMRQDGKFKIIQDHVLVYSTPWLYTMPDTNCYGLMCKGWPWGPAAKVNFFSPSLISDLNHPDIFFLRYCIKNYRYKNEMLQLNLDIFHVSCGDMCIWTFQ